MPKPTMFNRQNDPYDSKCLSHLLKAFFVPRQSQMTLEKIEKILTAFLHIKRCAQDGAKIALFKAAQEKVARGFSQKTGPVCTVKEELLVP